MADNPSASLFAKAGPIAPSQLAYINSTPFLCDDTLPSPPPSPPPPAVKAPVLNCALNQVHMEPEPEPGPEPDEQAPPPPPLEVVDVGDGDVVEVPEPKKMCRRESETAPKPANAASASASAVDPLLEAVSSIATKLDPNLENMDILEICAMKGIFFAPPRWHRPGGYEKVSFFPCYLLFMFFFSSEFGLNYRICDYADGLFVLILIEEGFEVKEQ